jgi:hypothetical protein
MQRCVACIQYYLDEWNELRSDASLDGSGKGDCHRLSANLQVSLSPEWGIGPALNGVPLKYSRLLALRRVHPPLRCTYSRRFPLCKRYALAA